jgi:hypothetical protein
MEPVQAVVEIAQSSGNPMVKTVLIGTAIVAGTVGLAYVGYRWFFSKKDEPVVAEAQATA